MTQLPPDVDLQVKQYLASGQYLTAEDVLRDALRALAEEQGVVTDIRRGLEDLDAGRGRALEDVDADLRSKHNIPQDV
jgi:Arc/MetJ-type ribon-helix-helix transcriptional regulator